MKLSSHSREREREGERETRERDKERQTERDRQTDTERYREVERERKTIKNIRNPTQLSHHKWYLSQNLLNNYLSYIFHIHYGFILTCFLNFLIYSSQKKKRKYNKENANIESIINSSIHPLPEKILSPDEEVTYLCTCLLKICKRKKKKEKKCKHI